MKHYKLYTLYAGINIRKLSLQHLLVLATSSIVPANLVATVRRLFKFFSSLLAATKTPRKEKPGQGRKTTCTTRLKASGGFAVDLYRSLWTVHKDETDHTKDSNAEVHMRVHGFKENLDDNVLRGGNGSHGNGNDDVEALEQEHR